MDYRRCTMTAQHWVELGIQCVGIGVLVSALVYRSWWGMLSICAGAPLLWRRDRRIWIWQKKEQLKQEFREVMEIVSGGLHAGYSLENAFLSARATADREYPLMSRELTLLANGLSCRKRLEELLLELGRRSGVPEIMEFAGLVETAKVYGGNIPQLIRQMTDNFAQTEQLEAEIQTVIAAKRLEGRIMLVVPFAILMYFRVLNPSYMQVLYHTIAGRCCMTICMLIIAACAGWIDKIVRIEV